jgi:uncharacterized RDD family membrane protein YckC
MSVEMSVSTPVLRRYAQFVLDRLLVVGLSMAVFLVSLGLALLAIHFGGSTTLLYGAPVLMFPTMILSMAWVDVWVPYRRGGATPAMRWLGLRIVTEYGTQPRLRDYVVRCVLSVVDGLLFGLVGALLIAMTEKHQRAGDLAARTLVVRINEPTPDADPVEVS